LGVKEFDWFNLATNICSFFFILTFTLIMLFIKVDLGISQAIIINLIKLSKNNTITMDNVLWAKQEVSINFFLNTYNF
jgi:hypothetical protein